MNLYFIVVFSQGSGTSRFSFYVYFTLDIDKHLDYTLKASSTRARVKLQALFLFYSLPQPTWTKVGIREAG